MDTLRQLQLTQVEILKEIDKVCKKYSIKYSLYAGTLLGAVRHKGFIPWDDDLDVCMSRPDYERFLSVWPNENVKGYILQNKENTPSFTQSFSKIRKEHTTFLQYEWERNRYHTGIFVDIFPIDRMPTNTIKRKIFTFECMLLQLYYREFVPPKAGAVTRMVTNGFLLCVPQKKRSSVRRLLTKRITANSSDKNNPTVAIETVSTITKPLSKSLLDDYCTLEFEGAQFMCFKEWDSYLTTKYRDYMKLPPESERTWTHHPIILDFERDYNEICV